MSFHLAAIASAVGGTLWGWWHSIEPALQNRGPTTIRVNYSLAIDSGRFLSGKRGTRDMTQPVSCESPASGGNG